MAIQACTVAFGVDRVGAAHICASACMPMCGGSVGMLSEFRWEYW